MFGCLSSFLELGEALGLIREPDLDSYLDGSLSDQADILFPLYDRTARDMEGMKDDKENIASSSI